MDESPAVLVGQRIQLVCRQAAPEEVGQARRHEEEAERESMPDTQETRLIRMMEDIHRLAVNPCGEALRIQTFSGSTHPTRMRPPLPNGFMKSGRPKVETQRLQ